MIDFFWLLTFGVDISLAFFCTVFLVESIFRLFRLENPRIRSQFRMVPVVYAVLTPFLGKWGIAQYLNPLHCESCLQKLILFFLPHLQKHLAENKISLTSYMNTEGPFLLFGAMFLFLIFATGWIWLCKISRAISLHRWLKKILDHATPSLRQIENPMLRAQVNALTVRILVSKHVQGPMAVYRKTMVIPQALALQLTQEEFEAICAHEIEHLLRNDPIHRLFYRIIAALFWWVPMHRWIQCAEDEQELACDASVERYGLAKKALASGLLRVIHYQREGSWKPETVLCGLADKSSLTLLRFKVLLALQKMPNKPLKWIGLATALMGSGLLLSCMM